MGVNHRKERSLIDLFRCRGIRRELCVARVKLIGISFSEHIPAAEINI